LAALIPFITVHARLLLAAFFLLPLTALRPTCFGDTPKWLPALPGHQIRFPQDHFPHPDFRTEWWYFTGHLKAQADADLRDFGFQITFFRNGITPPQIAAATRSNFILRDVIFAHVAVSDLTKGTFTYDQILRRGSLGEAGLGPPGQSGLVVHVAGSSLQLQGDGSWFANIVASEMQMALTFKPTLPPLFHGDNGLSAKGDAPGQATYYYSSTRLQTSGTVILRGTPFHVIGSSWLDREWGSSQLAPEQTGWDWFSLELSNGTDLVLYQLRTTATTVSRNSSGTLRLPNGETRHLPASSFTLTPLDHWTSDASGARYPVAWKIEIPLKQIVLHVTTPLKNQELRLAPVTYWEGAITAAGTHGGSPVTARGYLELTGYDAPLRALQSPR
jgi:predicted secreted hydrolase